VLLNQLHHLGLLQRGHPAADDSFAGTGRLQELQLHVRLQRVGQAVPIDDQGVLPGNSLQDRSEFGRTLLRAGEAVSHSVGRVQHLLPGFPELLPHFEDGVAGDNEHLCHVVRQHLARIADVHGRLLLISGQHPNLDVGQRQEGNGLWDPLLELVLNGCCAQQHHVVLHLLVHAGQPVLPAVPGQAGLEPSLGPLPIVLFVQILVGQNQGPQPLPGVFIQVVGGGAEQPPGAGVKPLQQDRVGPFAVQSDPPFWISHDD